MENATVESKVKFDINSYEDYQNEYAKSISDPEGFWDEKANRLQWRKKWIKTLEWNFKLPEIRWFIGGKLNITENCLERNLAIHPDKTAFIWEPNDPSEKSIQISYKELFSKVCNFANVLKSHGVKKGDTVCIYLPMIPELAIAMLACARIGAIHSVVYAGFSSGALASRITDAGARLLITSDGAYRGEKEIAMKDIVDEALTKSTFVYTVIVVKRTNSSISFKKGRDVWWHDEVLKVNDQCPAQEMDAEDILFILYTSGSTGKPKGIVHTCGGYMVYTDYTFRTIFQATSENIYWCTADFGWITGHSYLLYGPLLSGVTSVIYEGIPTYPTAERPWNMIDKYKVNVFYTSPTAIRTLETYGTTPIEKHSLKSLKVLGSVGEPLNESAWHWYDTNIGKNKCPIIDTWWQTETGGIMISPFIPINERKPGYAMFPLPGVVPVIVNDQGEELKGNDVEGNLCFSKPWPGILKTIYHNHERFKNTYFSRFPGLYFSEDNCRRDKDGHYRITGRTDDVIKVSGHLLGTAEIENAISEHKDVVESAIVGYPHPIKGNAIAAFVITDKAIKDVEKFRQEIISIVAKNIGAIAKPEKILIVTGLPKTRSGKIMRRILKKIMQGEKEDFGDTTTLTDPSVVKEIIKEVNE